VKLFVKIRQITVVQCACKNKNNYGKLSSFLVVYYHVAKLASLASAM